MARHSRRAQPAQKYILHQHTMYKGLLFLLVCRWITLSVIWWLLLLRLLLLLLVLTSCNLRLVSPVCVGGQPVG
jgi:hypothetical protein